VRIVLAIVPPDFPRVEAIHVDEMTLAFAAAITLLTGTVSSLWPAFRSARGDLAAALQAGAGGSTTGFGAMPAQKVRNVLLAAESAFAVLLLVIAALLARSFTNIVHVEPGYTPEGVLAATVHLPGGDAATGRRAELMWELLDRLRAIPDVTVAGAANMTPLDPAIVLAGFPVPREIGNEGSTLRFAQALHYTVTPGYAEALKLRLIEGRLFVDADLRPGLHSMIVNEEFARLYLPPHPTGRRYTWAGEPLEIVGVVADVLKNGYEQPPQAELYVPLRPGDPVWGGIRIMTRVRGDASVVGLAIRGIVRQLAPDAAIEVERLTARLAASVAQPRFASLAMLTYAGFALTLSSLGLYGALSYGVSRRRRELAVRVALGASPGALMQLVLREGLGVTGIGLAVGLTVAVATTHLLKSLLFGVTAVDMVAFIAAPVLLATVAVGASVLPAYRAASIDPLDALRE
jgi:predicted permease